MDWSVKISSWIKGVTQISLLLLALGITWQVLFGNVEIGRASCRERV